MTPEQVRQIIREELAELIKSDRFVFYKLAQFLDGRNIQLGTATGTRIGTATTQKIGFLGKAPVIRQTTTSQSPATFAANTSGIADDSATWGGYTVGDLVAILQAFGFIA